MIFPLLFLACGTSDPVSQVDESSGPVQVHLTIDDAPWMIQRGHTVPHSAAEVAEKNDALIEVLAKRDVSASVFFNCSRLQPGDGTLDAWSSAGHTIGNHTHTHAPLNTLGAEAWLEDARTCHDQLEAAGVPPRWHRYPFLGYGDGAESRDAAIAGLATMGERTAPVTVATTEWLHAYTYRKAIRLDDDALKAEVVADYHQHMDDALEAGREAARELVDREIPQVVLIHLNELALNELGTLIDRWQTKGVTFVDLDTAMADPVFDREVQYDGTAGISWLWRTREPDTGWPRYWFGHEEGRVQERFGDIDPADMGRPLP